MSMYAQVLRIHMQLDADHDRLAKREHPQSFDFAGSFPAVNLNNEELFRIPSVAEMPMDGMFTEPTLLANTVVQQPEMQWMGPDGKSSKKHRGPAKQPSYARAKNNPERQLARQEAKNQIIEWLLDELENRPGYCEFREAFNTTQHNSGAIKSWTFAVEFKESYNKLRLVVSVIFPLTMAS
jgi:hypothetical protein